MTLEEFYAELEELREMDEYLWRTDPLEQDDPPPRAVRAWPARSRHVLRCHCPLTMAAVRTVEGYDGELGAADWARAGALLGLAKADAQAVVYAADGAYADDDAIADDDLEGLWLMCRAPGVRRRLLGALGLAGVVA